MNNHLEKTATGALWAKLGIHPHHGVALPLASLHSNESCGIGEYLDLISLIRWCSEVGMDVIQLLPLNDTGNDPSPYSARSAMALHPIYIAPSALQRGAEDAELQQLLQRLRQRCRSQRVSYHAVLQEKMAFFHRYFDLYGAEEVDTEEFNAFCRNHSWLEGYLHYLEELGESPDLHRWLQYLCHAQLTAAAGEARAHNIQLMGDIPILISRESADVKQHPELFREEFSAGAPPDYYSPKGQNWGFPLYNWEAHFESNFAWWRNRIEAAAAYYQIFRIDHIVGFFRLWAIPPGEEGCSGHYLPEDFSFQLDQGRRILEQLCSFTDMLPIGEDLGVVPDEVREILAELGICRTKVVRWERAWHEEGHPYLSVKNYPPDSLTTVSTHDSEPLQLWWERVPEEAHAYAKQKGWEYQRMLSHDHLSAMLAESHASGSLFTINPLQEYLALFPDLIWGGPEEERVNIPGTSSLCNWSYRFFPTLEEMHSHNPLKQAVWSLVQSC